MVWFCLTLLGYCYFPRRSAYSFGADMQCGYAHPPEILNHRPFGLDRLEQILRANSEGHLMELFLFHFRLWGNTLTHTFLGNTAIGTIDPRNLKTILSSRVGDWSISHRQQVMAPLLGEGIFTQEGPRWKQSRTFVRRHLLLSQHHIIENFQTPLDMWLERLPSDTIVDLQPLLFDLMLDVTTSFLLGHIPNDADKVSFAQAFNAAQEGIAKRMRLQPFHWLLRGHQFLTSCNHVHKFVDDAIHQSRQYTAESKKQHSFLQRLIEQCDRRAVRAQIINVLVAGRDATACLISWAM